MYTRETDGRIRRQDQAKEKGQQRQCDDDERSIDIAGVCVCVRACMSDGSLAIIIAVIIASYQGEFSAQSALGPIII